MSVRSGERNHNSGRGASGTEAVGEGSRDRLILVRGPLALFVSYRIRALTWVYVRLVIEGSWRCHPACRVQRCGMQRGIWRRADAYVSLWLASGWTASIRPDLSRCATSAGYPGLLVQLQPDREPSSIAVISARLIWTPKAAVFS
jgi:hypothetical protein